MNPENGTRNSCSSGGTMLRMLGAAQKREVKATQNLAIIVLFFMICWIPLYTINCVLAFCKDCPIDSTFMFSCIILSHVNSAGNPLLYAYHLRDFRAALKNFFCNLFGYNEAQVAQTPRMNASCNNYTDCRVNRDNSEKAYLNSQIYYKKKIADRVNSARVTVAVAVTVAAGEANRDMWNIPEGSSDSSDSLKHNEKIEKISIVRPATPYRPHQTTDVSQVNQAYIETSSIDEESDDVFVDDSFPFADFKYDSELESNLTDKIKKEIKIVSASTPLASSSPQHTRSLFLVENEIKESTMKLMKSDTSSLDIKRYKNSPFKVVEMYKNKPKLGRSLSDEGTTSNESITKKSNGNVVRSSCGS